MSLTIQRLDNGHRVFSFWRDGQIVSQFMVHPDRSVETLTESKFFNVGNARVWMQANKSEYADPKTGEIQLTPLVEACADAFGVNDVGGPLDDSDHWIWDLAVSVGEVD